jgi:hypothetical protein
MIRGGILDNVDLQVLVVNELLEDITSRGGVGGCMSAFTLER